MVERTALEERVEHIQNDVAEIKKDIRRLDDKIDGLGNELRNKIDDLGNELRNRIDVVRTEIASLALKVTASENAILKLMIRVVIGAVGTASAIAFGVAKLVN